MIQTHFNYQVISPEIWEEIYTLYTEEKLSLAKICKLLQSRGLKGIYSKKIAEYLRSRSIEVLNNQNERGTQHDIFSVIDTEEKAYFLGLLYADGYIAKRDNTIELCLHVQDEATVKAFKEFIGADNQLYYSKDWNTVRFAFGSKQIKSDLVKLGCGNAKSLTLTFPDETQVPKHLLSHFIRGYFDGDGCISGNLQKNKTVDNCYYYPVISILGTEHFIRGIHEFTIDKSNSIVKKASRCEGINMFEYKLSFLKAKNFLEQIYKDSTISLLRKKERYKLFKINNYKIPVNSLDVDLFKKCYGHLSSNI